MPNRHKVAGMDLRHLRTFIAVAEDGTVSKAALRLRVAQPALSRQITDLEGELGVKLFDRVRRRLILTSEGEQLLGDCRAVLGTVGSLAERAQRLRRGDGGILKLAATPQTIDGLLSNFLSTYRKRQPNVQIRLREAFGTSLMELLERGEVHVAMSTGGAMQAGHHAFETIWLPPLEFLAACNREFELGKAESMDVRRLGPHPLLLLDTSFAVRTAFDAACRVAEFKPTIFFESRTPHTLLALAEAGHGIAVVPSVLPTHRYDVRTVRLTYRGRPLRERYGIMWDKRRRLPPYAEDFCRSLAAHIGGATALRAIGRGDASADQNR